MNLKIEYICVALKLFDFKYIIYQTTTSMEIILFQPQIPQNTGNIVRTCSVTGTGLILVNPLGFSVSDRSLKRAGLDYWNEVHVRFTDDLFEYLSGLDTNFYFFSSHAAKPYTSIDFQSSDHLIFGSETGGLPPIYLDKWREKFYTIPMKKESRCLNLSNAVSIVLYEALRQNRFSF